MVIRLLRVERLAARQHLNHLGDLAGPARSSLRVASVTLVEDLFVVRLSVTVPAYRPGSHLEPCLDSPLEQGIDAEDYEDLRRRGPPARSGARLDQAAHRIRLCVCIGPPRSGRDRRETRYAARVDY